MRRSAGSVVLGVALAASMSLGLAGCGGSGESAGGTDSAAKVDSAAEQAAPEEQQSVAVTVDGAQMATDYQGNPCVVVTYTFTNVSDKDAQAFDTAAYSEVYQNGVQCDLAVCDSVDGNSALTKVQAGNSTQVQLAYGVSDTSDIDVKVYPIVNLDNTTLAEKTFSLA